MKGKRGKGLRTAGCGKTCDTRITVATPCFRPKPGDSGGSGRSSGSFPARAPSHFRRSGKSGGMPGRLARSPGRCPMQENNSRQPNAKTYSSGDCPGFTPEFPFNPSGEGTKTGAKVWNDTLGMAGIANEALCLDQMTPRVGYQKFKQVGDGIFPDPAMHFFDGSPVNIYLPGGIHHAQ